MIARRTFMALAAVATLSACAEPLVQSDPANRLQIADVVVEADYALRVKGRPVTIGSERIKTDVRAAVVAAFQQVPQGTRAANVKIEVTEVFLASGGAAALGARSKVDSIVTVTDAVTGTAILAPTEFEGLSIQDMRFGGIVGAAVTASISPADDYRETVSRYAATLRMRLLGGDT